MRANTIHAGGSLAGNVSIRLSKISSSVAVVSIFLKGRAVPRPFRRRWSSDVPFVIDIRLSGSFDSGRTGELLQSRPKLEGEDDERDAEDERVDSYPPCEHNGADQRRDDQEHTIGKRQ